MMKLIFSPSCHFAFFRFGLLAHILYLLAGSYPKTFDAKLMTFFGENAFPLSVWYIIGLGCLTCNSIITSFERPW